MSYSCTMTRVKVKQIIRKLNSASVWIGCTWHPMGAKRRTWDNEPSQNKNKCFDLILSKPHDPQMFLFTGIHTREDTGGRWKPTAIKCTCCCTADCFSTAIVLRQMMKRHQNEHQHYGHHAGGMVKTNFSGTKLWFQKVVGKAESTLRGHNWRAALLTQLPKMGKSQTAPPPLYF